MKISHWLRKHSLAVECSLIFATCVFVYLANNRTITTHDPIPNTLLAFNWIFNHQLNFDNFRGSYFFNMPVWFFTESPTGHLTSAYPIGTAIVTFPFYLIFSVIRWLDHLIQDPVLRSSLYSFNIQQAIFDPDRLYYEKLAATLTTSSAVVLFHLAANLKFRKTICLILTFTYAFATQNWVTNSQALLQHTAANLVICGILLCLLKANRTQGRLKKLLLLVAGIFCGLIPGIRPTDTVFSIAAIVYAVFVYRRDCIFLGLGLSSAFISISWNLYYFGTLFLGGYASQTALYVFQFKQSIQAFVGLLFSPGRGLFVFSPVLLFMIPGALQIFKLRSKQDEQLLLCLTSAGIALFINYCFFSVWWGAWSYGNRFLADALPIFCFLVGYALTEVIELKAHRKTNYQLVCFFSFLLFSTFVQCVGAFTLEFGKLGWDAIPAEIDSNTSIGVDRLWRLQDSPIERSVRNLFHDLTGLPATSQSYFDRINGIIEHAEMLDRPSENKVILGTSGDFALLQVDLQNTGVSDWLGYDTGLQFGSIAVRARFYDQNDKMVKQGAVYIPGVTHPTQRTRATGFITLPSNYGTYRLVLDLVKSQTSADVVGNQYELQVNIDQKQQIFDQLFKQVRVPKEISVGKTAKLFTIIESRSNFAWSSKVRDTKNEIEYPVSLSYRWLNENSEAINGEETLLPWTVHYKQNWFYSVANQIAMNTTIKAPERPGNYILQLTMVQADVGRFDEKGAKPKDIPITITSN